jgi:hypothetical protein
MAAVTRIALFIWNAGEPTRYSDALRSWTRGREGVTLFSDRPAEGEYHYLRFDAMQQRNPFDLLIYDVDDTAPHAAGFFRTATTPGVLFFSDVALSGYALAVSHDAADPWGTRWIFNIAAPEDAALLSRLAERGLDISGLLSGCPAAVALAVRSAAVVVPEFGWATRLSGVPDVPPVAVIDPREGQAGFEALMERMLPLWLRRTEEARTTILPVEHPHSDLFTVERQRILNCFPPGSESLAEPALAALAECFRMDDNGNDG